MDRGKTPPQPLDEPPIEAVAPVSPTPETIKEVRRLITRAATITTEESARNHPILTKDEESVLSEVVQDGLRAAANIAEIEESGARLTAAERRSLRLRERMGKEATDAFIVHNLRLVAKIAARYVRPSGSMEHDDLIQEGRIGMMHAVELFDPDKGFKFSTYATWWVRQAITRSLSNQGRTIRVPVHIADQLRVLKLAREKVTTEKGDATRPTVAELAQQMNMTEGQVRTLIDTERLANLLSMQAPIGDDGELELGDTLADRETSVEDEALGRAASADLSDQLYDILAKASSGNQREHYIITERFGLNDGERKTLEAIGEVLGLTRERVRQIERHAMGKLRRWNDANDGKLSSLLE